jgi:hypothetical protein
VIAKAQRGELKMQNHQIQGGISLGIISFNQIGPKHKRV